MAKKQSIMNECLRLILENKSSSETWLSSNNYYEELKEWYSMYRGIPKRKPYNWMSNKFVPLAFSKVETGTANMVNMLFSINPPFEVRPREEQDVIQAKIVQKLLSYQFEEADIYEHFTEFIRTMLIFGTSIAKVTWDVQNENCTVWKPEVKEFFNPEGKKVGEDIRGFVEDEIVKQTYFGPRMINCNLNDIFPDPQAINIQDSWIIHRTRRTLDYLMNMNRLYPEIYNDNVKLIKKEDLGDEIENDENNITADMGRTNKTDIERVPNMQTIELLERWGMYDLNNKDESVLISAAGYTGKKSVGLEPAVITVACGKYIIRKEKNPFWHKKNPFIKGVYIPAVNEFYGIGLPEIIEDLQNNTNEMVNQRNDNISLALNTPILYNKLSNIDRRQLIIKPGGTYGVDGDVGSSLQFVRIESYTKDVFIHVADMERWADEATAIYKLTMGGMESGGASTATEIVARGQNSNSRFSLYSRYVERIAFRDLIKMFYQLNYQNITEEQVIRIVGTVGNEWIKISPEDIRRDYDFIPAGIFTMENKDKTVLRLIQFYNIVKGSPYLKETKVFEKIYYAMDLGDRPEELIRTDKEVQEIQNLASQMATQMVQEMIMKEQGKIISKGQGKTKGVSSGIGNMTGNEVVSTPGVPPPSEVG